MRDIRQVTCITKNPSGGKDDMGSCEVGFYTVEGGLLTMTDADGVPLRDSNNGERITHRLAPGESEKAIASRLTLKIIRTSRGDEMAGFSRRIDYPKWGGA